MGEFRPIPAFYTLFFVLFSSQTNPLPRAIPEEGISDQRLIVTVTVPRVVVLRPSASTPLSM